MRKNSPVPKIAALSAFVLSLGIATPLLAETTGQYLDDATITTKVKAAIIGDSNLKGASVSVETDKASVQLTGLVNTRAQENEAVRVADQVSGIRDVQDHLTIRSAEAQ